MGGMRLTPKHIHREVLQRDEDGDPVLYAMWKGVPHADGARLLGRTERLARPRWWRAFPADGTYPRDIRGWVNIIEWFLELANAELPCHLHLHG